MSILPIYLNLQTPLKDNLRPFIAFLNDCGANGKFLIRNERVPLVYEQNIYTNLNFYNMLPPNISLIGSESFDEGLLQIEDHICWLTLIVEGIARGERPPLSCFVPSQMAFLNQVIALEYANHESWKLQTTSRQPKFLFNNFALEDYVEICGILVPLLMQPDGDKELRRIRKCTACNKFFSARGKAPYCSEACRSRLNYLKLKEKKT